MHEICSIIWSWIYEVDQIEFKCKDWNDFKIKTFKSKFWFKNFWKKKKKAVRFSIQTSFDCVLWKMTFCRCGQHQLLHLLWPELLSFSSTLVEKIFFSACVGVWTKKMISKKVNSWSSCEVVWQRSANNKANTHQVCIVCRENGVYLQNGHQDNLVLLDKPEYHQKQIRHKRWT